MLDVIYLLATLALFAIVALVANGVEAMIPRARGSVQRGGFDSREAMSGETPR
ncbi:MAG: hypothetical protein KKH75_11280 [Actinobacteria bacterium]|nr:hypothetical protein [Actinomycetota bacterium]